MNEFDERPLPSASQIWQRAQFENRRRLAARSMAPMAMMRRLGLALAAVACIFAATAVPPPFSLAIGAALVIVAAAAICATVLA